MPTYEYQCDACDHRFDEFQSFSDKQLKKCPQCKKQKLRRLFGAGTAILFKGSGFYQTDYRSESYTSAAKADQEAAKPKTESQEAAKPKTESNGKSDPAGAGSSAKESTAGKKTSKSAT